MELEESRCLRKASLVAQTVKNPSTMQETWVRSQGWEDPLEEGMATHSSILAWRIPVVEEPGWLQSTGAQELDTTEQPNTAQDKCLRSVEFSPPEYKARDDTHANVSISWVPSKYTHIHTHAHTYLRAVKHNIHTHTHSYTHDLRCSLFLSSSLNT